MKDKNITDTMGEKWEFNSEVSEIFTEMLTRSIPEIYTMRELTNNILNYHIRKHNLIHSDIIDVGCSNGESLKGLITKLPSTQFYGIDSSEPMIKEAKKNINFWNDNVTFINGDITKMKELPSTRCGAILSILTLQFIPIEYRQQVLDLIYNSLDKNGIFIMVEKVLGENAELSQLYEKLYYSEKHSAGYTYTEIREKKLKLEGVLVPLTDEYNIQLLKNTGFKKVGLYWKNLNFSGYIAYKE